MLRTTIIAMALALAVTLPTVPAQAQATRAFVSTAGSDTNNCINTNSPCRHFQNAYSALPAGGEIDVLDPGNYGALTVTHGLNIVGRGWATVTAPFNLPAITINAGSSDTIIISGVLLDGANLQNTIGIQFNSGGSLTVRDSVIRNLMGNGITFTPSASTLTKLFVSNTLVSDNGNNGIRIGPAGSASVAAFLSEVEIANCFNGIVVDASGGGVNVMVRNSSIINNSSTGLAVSDSGTTMRLTRSTITGNSVAWANGGGVISSYGDNNIDGNGADNGTPPNPLVYH
jgi:hypothetical protein